MAATYDSIVKDIKQNKIAPVYLLNGEEPYYIDEISKLVQQYAIKDEERSFNELIFYGKDANVIDIIHSARQYPMGAKRQLIIVREAQMLHEKNFEKFTPYLQDPLESTVLVISFKYKKIDKRKVVYKAADANKKNVVIFESAVLKEDVMKQWITREVAARNWTIEQKAVEMLWEFIGSDMENMVQAFEKLSIGNNKRLTPELIEKNIGFSKDYNVFEMKDAIVKRDALKAYKIALNIKEYPIPIIFNFFRDLVFFYFVKHKRDDEIAFELGITNQWAAKYQIADLKKAASYFSAQKTTQIISLLREYEMKSKGYEVNSTDMNELLRELIFKILH